MGTYLVSVTAAAIIAAIIRRISGKNGAWKAARLGAGLLVLLTAFGPVLDAEPMDALTELVERTVSNPLSTMELDLGSNALMESLIKEQAETYILDKAMEMGVVVTAEVETRLEKGYPIPHGVRLRGNVQPREKQKLTKIIAEELGIPEERQGWMDM